jgi:hypothetical protein
MLVLIKARIHNPVHSVSMLIIATMKVITTIVIVLHFNPSTLNNYKYEHKRKHEFKLQTELWLEFVFLRLGRSCLINQIVNRRTFGSQYFECYIL